MCPLWYQHNCQSPISFVRCLLMYAFILIKWVSFRFASHWYPVIVSRFALYLHRFEFVRDIPTLWPDVPRLHVSRARATIELAYSIGTGNREASAYTLGISRSPSADESCPVHVGQDAVSLMRNIRDAVGMYSNYMLHCDLETILVTQEDKIDCKIEYPSKCLSMTYGKTNRLPVLWWSHQLYTSDLVSLSIYIKQRTKQVR